MNVEFEVIEISEDELTEEQRQAESGFDAIIERGINEKTK